MPAGILVPIYFSVHRRLHARQTTDASLALTDNNELWQSGAQEGSVQGSTID